MTQSVTVNSLNTTRQSIDIIFKIVGTAKTKFVAPVEQMEFGQKISQIKHVMKNSSISGELGIDLESL